MTSPSRTTAEQAPRAVSTASNFMALRAGRRSKDAAGFLEGKPRIARARASLVAITDIAEEIRFDPRIGEKFAIDTRIVEAGHRTAIETQRARRDDKITSLQRAVAECHTFGHQRILVPVLRIRHLRIQKRK